MALLVVDLLVMILMVVVLLVLLVTVLLVEALLLCCGCEAGTGAALFLQEPEPQKVKSSLYR